MKVKLDEQGKRNAEKAIRYLNVSHAHKIIYKQADTSLLHDDFDKRSPDNLILSIALQYKHENSIVLTSYNDLQLKTKIVKIQTVSLKDLIRRLLQRRPLSFIRKLQVGNQISPLLINAKGLNIFLVYR